MTDELFDPSEKLSWLHKRSQSKPLKQTLQYDDSAFRIAAAKMKVLLQAVWKLQMKSEQKVTYVKLYFTLKSTISISFLQIVFKASNKYFDHSTHQ